MKILSLIAFAALLMPTVCLSAPTNVRCKLTWNGHDLPESVTKIGEPLVISILIDADVPEGEQSPGWTFEITPRKTAAGATTADVVVTHVEQGESKDAAPVPVSSTTTYKFTMPVEGRTMSVTLPSGELLKLQLLAVDPAGKPIKPEKGDAGDAVTA